MTRWFRFHADAMRNPKVARLSDAQFRLWVELMAVASENDGAIPCLNDLKHILKRRLDHLSRGLDDLLRAGLMDALTDGYEPHNWSKHQYKSDTSTDRVHKHREKRNVSETPPETDTDTEDVIAKAIPSPRAKRAVGARLSPGWKPSALPLAVAELVAQWPDGREAREFDNFHDYWRSRSRDAARLDWDATWHNRIRDIHDRVLRDCRNGRSGMQANGGNHVAPGGRAMGRTEAAARAVASRMAGTSEPGSGSGQLIALPDALRA